MITLKSLTLKGIGRFVEEQTIDITSLGQLVEVGGQNNNTGGSSGAAKSTVFKAIEFLFGVNDISSTVLQSRLTKEPLFVKGVFDLDGLPLTIERGKKLLIDLNGEVTTGSSKLTEEKLDEIIGMPRDLFRKILHKRQGEGGFFLDMGPSDVHKFLTNCLGLEKEQSKVVVLDTRLAKLTVDESSLKSNIESYRMGLEATQSAISSLGPTPTLEIDPSVIEELKKKHLGAVDTHKLVRDSHKREAEDLEKDRPQVTTTPFDRTRIVQLENEIGTILSQISNLERVEVNRQQSIRNQISSMKEEISKYNKIEQTRQTEVQSRITLNRVSCVEAKVSSNKGNEAKQLAIGLAKDLQKIRESLCPTCEQGWVTDTAKTKESDILAQLQECKKSMMVGIAADKGLVSLEEQRKQLDLEVQPKSIPEIERNNELIKSLNEELSCPIVNPESIELKLQVDFKNKEIVEIRAQEQDHQFKENSKRQLMMDQFALKQTNLRQTHESTIQFVRDEEGKALSEYESVSNKLKSFEESEIRFQESYQKLQIQANKYGYDLEATAMDLIGTQEEIELATESKKAIKSYLSCSFEDALDSIGDMATRLIRDIPNMSTATIQFEGLKETKEGKVKEEVTCLISMDGEIGIPVKSLSGGERSSVDIGIDLSVIKFIEERTGKGIDLFILDEAFNGLDSTCIEQAIEMLKNCSVDKRLFIVEHNPVISQSIENRLIVVRDGLTSKIVQQ